MSTPSFIPHGVSRALLSLLIVALASPLRPADDQAPKDYSIFMGLDVSVALKGKYRQVIGAKKNRLLIMVNGQPTEVPLAAAKDLRLDRDVKLTNLSANIANLQGAAGTNRAQTAAEMDAMLTGMALQDMAEIKRDKILGESVTGGSGILPQRSGGSQTSANSGLSGAEAALAQIPQLQRDINLANQNGSDLMTKKFDFEGGLNETGFIVSFEASAPVLLEECHVAVIADYTLPGGSGVALTNITLEPIGFLSPSARKISCELRRFPPGAEMTGYRVALYSRGQEIVTNLSSRRTDVTRADAVLYLTLEHLAKHHGETLPPTPVLMVSRSEFVSRLGSAPLDQVFYARIGKDGKVIRLSTDVSGSAHLPSDLSSAVDQIAFVPALEKGKPVEGVAKLKLADLVASN